MDVRGAALHRFVDQAVDQADDRGIVIAVQQVGSLRDAIDQAFQVGIESGLGLPTIQLPRTVDVRQLAFEFAGGQRGELYRRA